MKVAIDVSPLKIGHFLQHRVRGTGFYIGNLKRSFLQYYPQNQYTFFTRGELLSKNIDLVHYPYFEPFFLTLPILKRYKTVVTIHDLTPLVFPRYFPAGLRGSLRWQIQKFNLKRIEGIITDSHSSEKDIIKFTQIPSSKIHVVYLAPGEEFQKMEDTRLPARQGRWKMEIREKYNLPEKFVLYVGDVTWNKNLPRLIGAIKKINLTLVMVGKALVEKNIEVNNPWNQDLVKVQELIKNDKRIICLGFVPQEDLAMLYNLATVFIMPSLYEGFGLPILEAMNCGCPVVTTREGSIPEIAADAAFYVDAYDRDSIANGIGEVFFNQKLQTNLSQNGLRQVKKFNWEKTANKTIEVYKSL